MAVAQVFATAELVERILLQLPTIDLLLSKRVCRTFQNVHKQFPSINKALFLVPGTALDTAADARYPSPHQPSTISVLKKIWIRAGYELQLPEAASSSGIAFNPLLVQRLCSLQLSVDKDRDERHNHRDPIHLYPKLMFTASDASCNDMFFTQPPLQLVTTVVQSSSRSRIEKSFMGGEKLSELTAGWKNRFAKDGLLKSSVKTWGAGLKAQWLGD